MRGNKIIIVMVVILLMTSVTHGLIEYEAYNGQEDATAINAYIKGRELLINGTFMDIHDNPYERDIVKMASLDIVKKYGSFNFRPAEEVTSQELVNFLVRSIEGSDNADNIMLGNAQGVQADYVETLLNDAYRQRAQALGIIGEFDIVDDRPINRLNTAKFIGNATGIALETDFNNVFSFNDWNAVDPQDRPLVETVVANKLMLPDADGNFKPEMTLTRGEAANILSRINEYFHEDRNIQETFGLITEIKEYSEVVDQETINHKDIYVQGIDGSVSVINTLKNKQTRAQRSVIAYKNNVMSDERVLKAGDQIAYTQLDDEVRFIEVFNNDAIFNKIKEITADNEDLDVYFGKIIKKESNQLWKDDVYQEKKSVVASTDNGEVHYLTAYQELYSNKSLDFPVIKGDETGGIDLIAMSDRVQYIISQGKVLYAKVYQAEPSTDEGTIYNVDATNNQLSIFNYDNKIKTYDVSEYISIAINGIYSTLEDLSYGQEVKLDIADGKVHKIESVVFAENPAYIPEYGKMRIGEVYYLFNDRALVKLTDGSKISVDMDDDVTIIKGGNKVTIKALYEGDRLKLYFDDIYTKTPSKIEIEGKEQLIKNLYKGTLVRASSGTRQLTIENPYILNNNDWIAVDEYSKDLDLEVDTLIYANGELVRLDDINGFYKGETVYVATKDTYGVETGIKVAIKTGGERLHYDEIRDLSRPLDEFELDSRANIRYGDGTIFMKDSRLVSSVNLKEDENVFVISDFYKGTDLANVIRIVSPIEDIFDHIYIGAIEDVYRNSIKFKNHASLNNNEWDSVEDTLSKEFFYNTSTELVSIDEDDKPTEYSKYKFFQSEFSKDENKEEKTPGLDYKRYYGIWVTDQYDQSIVAMNIRHKGLIEDQNIDDKVDEVKDIAPVLQGTLKDFSLAKGTVDSIDTKWKRIKVTDSYDWNSKRGEWLAHRVDTYFLYENAIIIKDWEVIKPEEILPKQKVRVLKNDADGLVIFVED